jgi:hypothetical protein
VISKRKKILAGIFALVIGLSMAMPTRASANPGHHNAKVRLSEHHDNGRHNGRYTHRYHHNAARNSSWRWAWEDNHYRAYPVVPAYPYRARTRTLSENGQGMINPRNPNLYWACDSDGHHCHWAPRY